VTVADDVQHEERVRQEVRRQTRDLRRMAEGSEAEVKELRRLLGFYQSARTEPLRVPTWTVKPRRGKHSGIVVAQMTDWHLDEVVHPTEVMDMNAYDAKIASIRMRRWVDKVVSLPREYIAGLEIEGLVIPATGDLFTGDIHHELKESNERKLLASVLHWMEPVIAALETFGREYKNVAVYAGVGNHGRLSLKPVFKGRVHDNVEWLFWSVVRDRLADRKSPVVVNVSESMDQLMTVYGRNYLLTHGDQFKGGSGISGAFAPLSLGAHRKTKRQMVAGVPIESMVIGHLHQLINIPGVVMGGTMKGYDEFAFGHNLPPDPNGAGQAMWVTTPERSQTMWMPVYLQDRKAEGW
jgi:hypothetical protein